jgi:TolB-like protein/Tfp pilus assembly protein PilF
MKARLRFRFCRCLHHKAAGLSAAFAGICLDFPADIPDPLGHRRGKAMDEKKQIAAVIRDYLARERISREQFAFRTRLGKSTVDKLVTGLFSDRTLSIVEAHTNLPLRQTPLGATRPAGGTQPDRTAALPRLDTPSIAVLPFTNMSGDPDQDFVADGISEDIITALARLRWLFVIARHSSFVFKGRAADVREVARELGVRYVLEGSVRTAGRRIRVTGQLIDAETGKHIWAEKYDREIEDLFAVQDDITERVVAAVEPHLYAEEGFRASAKQPDSIDAWGLVVRALSLINRMERRQNEEAQALLSRAIAMDPGYARAHALLSWAVWWATHLRYSWPGAGDGYGRAAAHAQDALNLDPADPWARMVFGLCLSTAGQHDRGLGEFRTALHLNPSFALGHAAYGWALLRAGFSDEAIAETERALRMSPLDTFSGFYTSIHGLALLAARRFEEALPFMRASVAAFAEYSGHYNQLISCCGHLGLLEEAKEFIAASNRVGPPLRVSEVDQVLSRFAHRQVFVEGLRKAGVPE